MLTIGATGLSVGVRSTLATIGQGLGRGPRAQQLGKTAPNLKRLNAPPPQRLCNGRRWRTVTGSARPVPMRSPIQ